MSTPCEKFQELLKKLFQFDCAELDFGIYRIMNQKRAVIEQFIETDLVKGIAKELKSGALAQEAGLAQQLAEVTAQIKENIDDEALDAEGNLAVEYHGSKLGKQYLALRERAGKAKATPEQEAEIFNHLYVFFSRYYDDGDFMSLRRYSKRDKYAIPYNGEEVHLHWANADQYYIKTGENFTDYSCKHGGWTVQFKLRNADVEQNNVKGAKRFFIPRAADVLLDEKNSTLTIPFEFRPLNTSEEISYGKGNGAEENGNGKAKVKKKKGQEGILADAIAAIQNAVKKNADALTALLHEKRKDADCNPVSLLEHHLRAYTRANSTDFFIHKDLKGFLERELDFYLKNEVLNLDELEAGGEARSESWFQTLRAIKGIGRKIIAFVAQIENFQKRLFEKKKFVTEVHYCVTLDRVPEELYPEIAKNKAQIEEWKRLFHINEIERDTTHPGFKEPVKVEFLKANPFLVLDTKFFPDERYSNFLETLLTSKKFLGSVPDVDGAIDGVLVNSENLHALTLLRERYREAVKSIYIDPPYNTDASVILYKNDFRHSSWLSMVGQGLDSAQSLLREDGILCATIDDFELHHLSFLLERAFGTENHLGTLAIRNNPQGRSTVKGFRVTHEYAYFYSASKHVQSVGRLERSAKQEARYDEIDESGGKYLWENFRKTGTDSQRADRMKQFYPLYCQGLKVRVPKMEWIDHTDEWKVLEKPKATEKEVWPKDEFGTERVWKWGVDRVLENPSHVRAEQDKEGNYQVFCRNYPDMSGTLPPTWWAEAKYAAGSHGTNLLTHMFGTSRIFSFPKGRAAAGGFAGDVQLSHWPARRVAPRV
jgi:adenine-specific DNA-methyltransferase